MVVLDYMFQAKQYLVFFHHEFEKIHTFRLALRSASSRL
jgi:hypothetical protein